MGQYHFVLNLDKKEFLHPHRLGDGLKLMEFGNSGGGTMTALGLLLAGCAINEPADSATQSLHLGSWAGDRIAIIGDYAEAEDLPVEDAAAIYDQIFGEQADGSWTDRSPAGRELIEAQGELIFEAREPGNPDSVWSQREKATGEQAGFIS
jgi:hypothetical protein